MFYAFSLKIKYLFVLSFLVRRIYILTSQISTVLDVPIYKKTKGNRNISIFSALLGALGSKTKVPEHFIVFEYMYVCVFAPVMGKTKSDHPATL